MADSATTKVVAYLKKADGQDKNLKLVQYVMKTAALHWLGDGHSFEPTRKRAHEAIGDARRYLAFLKWFYQINALSSEVEKWNGPLKPREALKAATLGSVCVEQVCGDLGLVHDMLMPGLPKAWLDFIFAIAKMTANILTMLDEFVQLQKKKLYRHATSSNKYEDDLPRHRLAILRCCCDVLIYASWIQNWKLAAPPKFMNLLGLTSSVIGVYEVFNPHAHSSV